MRNLRRAGVDESVIMTISGHKTASVFERYNIVDSRDRREAGFSWCPEGKSNASPSKGDFKIRAMLVNFNADEGFRDVFEYAGK